MLTRARFLVGLLLVTAGAGAFAVAFRASLAAVYRGVYGADNVVTSFVNLPVTLRLFVPIAAAGLAGTIACLRHAPRQGVSNVMEAIALGRVQLSLRATASRVASSWVAISGGLSIGREGPLIEVGGALAAAVGRRISTSLTETRVLVAAGTAAGFAAAYNTPFAASLFEDKKVAAKAKVRGGGAKPASPTAQGSDAEAKPEGMSKKQAAEWLRLFEQQRKEDETEH